MSSGAPTVVTINDPVTVVRVVEEVTHVRVAPDDTVNVVTVGEPTVDVVTIGIQGPEGIQGARGPEGRAGAPGDSMYTHVQAVPSRVWRITHNLGRRPVVQVFDSADEQVIVPPHHISDDELELTFSGAFSGVAYVGG